MKWFLFGVAVLHGVFMLGELLPWRSPLLLQLLSKKLPKGQEWTDSQQALVATIVHNAGIYNAILAAGLFWAAWAGEPARDVARILLAGVALAGVFGTATVKSPLTALQALVGIGGLAFA